MVRWWVAYFLFLTMNSFPKILRHSNHYTFSDLKKLTVKTLALSFLSPVIVIFSTRLAVILKFPYLSCLRCFDHQPFTSLIDKQVKHNVLTTKKSVHVYSNFKHQNNKPSMYSFHVLYILIHNSFCTGVVWLIFFQQQ